MLLSTLFSLSADLCLVDVQLEGGGLDLVLRSSLTSTACPACAQPSTHIGPVSRKQLPSVSSGLPDMV